ncbi:hypothetical protein [Caproiciproducens sp. MSJ-32]|uniref:hypothetical protein n=1 Tax=Caproiciproducens sp. MSJ-32 TaxID=2841527 RepID=UPI001C0FC478|nr:hypothetical protein [Caproiciproducens sp. MSJ-32]MBU5455401.1 hypothetical protein [Caproiciproducens sp. MSJ-32]
MFKEAGVNLVPILHVIIPITLGILTAYVYNRYLSNKKIKGMLACFSVSFLYHFILSFFTASRDEMLIIWVLFVWNSTLIVMSYKLFSYIYNK